MGTRATSDAGTVLDLQGVTQQEVYFETVYALWLAKSQKHITPLEFAYIDAWRDAGIPLHAVTDGINRCFANFRPRFSGDSIKSLRYCQQAIFELAEQYSTCH